MKFVTYRCGETENTGILMTGRVIPLEGILKREGHPVPYDMTAFISIADEALLGKLKEYVSRGTETGYSLDQVYLCAPIPYPKRDVICLGKNYKEHAQEIADTIRTQQSVPGRPIYFSKSAYPAIGPGEIIDSHRDITDELDYEAELAVVIGKTCRNIDEKDVKDYIFGYTIINDVSARNLQRGHEQWYRGKSLDTFCPMGPCIVHKSAVPWPVELDISCEVNGEIRQKSNTRNMIFNIPCLVSELSHGMTLYPGDIIATGTPQGVGLGFKPPRFLKSGDRVSCVIEGIGELYNTVG